MVVDNGWSGVTLGGSGWAVNNAFFKKVNYQLTEAHCKPNPLVDCIWIYTKPGQEGRTIPASAGANWTKVPNMDIGGEGDVFHIANWPAKHTFA